MSLVCHTETPKSTTKRKPPIGARSATVNCGQPTKPSMRDSFGQYYVNTDRKTQTQFNKHARTHAHTIKAPPIFSDRSIYVNCIKSHKLCNDLYTGTQHTHTHTHGTHYYSMIGRRAHRADRNQPFAAAKRCDTTHGPHSLNNTHIRKHTHIVNHPHSRAR